MISPPVPAEIDPPLRVAMPPYTALEPVPPVMPLGSIFILDVDKDASAIRGVSSTLRRAPWAPLLVVTRAPAGNPDVLQELDGVPGSPAFLVRRPDEGLPLASQAQHAVLSRRPADPEQVAGYVASPASAAIDRHADDDCHVGTAARPRPRGVRRALAGGTPQFPRRPRGIGMARGLPSRHRCRQPPTHQRASGGAHGPRPLDAAPATAAPRQASRPISTASTPGGNGSLRASCAPTVACRRGRWKAKRPHLGGRGT